MFHGSEKNAVLECVLDGLGGCGQVPPLQRGGAIPWAKSPNPYGRCGG